MSRDFLKLPNAMEHRHAQPFLHSPANHLSNNSVPAQRLADPVLVQRLYHAIDSLSSATSPMQLTVHRDSLITHTMSLYKMRKDMEPRLKEALALAIKDGTLVEIVDARHRDITYFQKPFNMATIPMQRTFQHDPYCLACQRPSTPLYKCKRCAHSMHPNCHTLLSPPDISSIVTLDNSATTQIAFICDACQVIMQSNNSDWDPEEQVLYLFHSVFTRKDFQTLRNVADVDEALLRFFVMHPLDTELMAGKVLLKKYRSGHHFLADILHVSHTAGLMCHEANSRTQESSQELLKSLSSLLDEMNMCRECFLRNREGGRAAKTTNREAITQLCAKRHRVVYCNYGASLCLPAKLLGHTYKGEPVIQYFGRNGKPEVISPQDYMSEDKPEFFGLQPSTSQLLSTALRESETYLRRLKRRSSHPPSDDENSENESSPTLPTLSTPPFMNEIAELLLSRYQQRWKKIPSSMTKQLGRHYLDSLQRWTEHLKMSRSKGISNNNNSAVPQKGKRKRGSNAHVLVSDGCGEGEPLSKKALEDETQQMLKIIEECAPNLGSPNGDFDLRQLSSPPINGMRASSSTTPTAAEVWQAAKHDSHNFSTTLPTHPQITTSSTDSSSIHGEALTMHYLPSSPSQPYLDTLTLGGPGSHDMLSSVSSSGYSACGPDLHHLTLPTVPPTTESALFGDVFSGLFGNAIPSSASLYDNPSYHIEATEHLALAPTPASNQPFYTQVQVDAMLAKQRRELKAKAKQKYERRLARALADADVKHRENLRTYSEKYRAIVSDMKLLHNEEMSSRSCVICKGKEPSSAFFCITCYQRATTHSVGSTVVTANVHLPYPSSHLYQPSTTIPPQQHRPH